MKFEGQVSYFKRDFQDCIRNLKACKNMLQYYSFASEKVHCYRFIGLSFMALKLYSKSEIYLTKYFSLLYISRPQGTCG